MKAKPLIYCMNLDYDEANQAADMGQFGLRSGIKTSVQRELKHVGDMVTTAGRQSTARLKSAGAAVKDRVICEAISAGKAADSMVTSAKYIASPRRVVSMNELGNVHIPAENTRFFENKIKDTLTKADGASVSSGVKGTVNNRQIDFTRGFDVDPKYSSYEQRVKTTPVNKGEWSNERAESLFISDKTGEIKKYLDEAGVDGVEYKNGMPDFSPFSKGEIKLENMTNDRKSNTADEELAKKWSTPEQKWTAEDIADWREDNKYTWHELRKTSSYI